MTNIKVDIDSLLSGYTKMVLGELNITLHSDCFFFFFFKPLCCFLHIVADRKMAFRFPGVQMNNRLRKFWILVFEHGF